MGVCDLCYTRAGCLVADRKWARSRPKRASLHSDRICAGCGRVWSGAIVDRTASVTQGRQRIVGGRILMSSQVAICLLLLVAAGLLLHTLRKYQTQKLGMNVHNLLVFGVTPQRAQTAPEAYAFYQVLLDRVRA